MEYFALGYYLAHALASMVACDRDVAPSEVTWEVVAFALF
jgi:hypothetical protein